MSQTGLSHSGPGHEVPEFHVLTRVLRLEPGLFSLSLTRPGGQASAFAGARVCAPPGPAGRPETVAFSMFRSDGWLTAQDEPMIIRVAAGGALVLLTIYWPASDGPGAAPALKLTPYKAEGSEPVPTPAVSPPSAPPASGRVAADVAAALSAAMAGRAPTAPARPSAGGGEIVAHVQGVGDVDGAIGDWVGMRGSGRAIEGFRIAPPQGLSADDFEVRAVLGHDWLAPWLPGGSYCGSRGLALPLRGFSLRLRPAAAARYDLLISARFVDGAEAGPLGSDQIVAAPAMSGLEAFQIILRPRGG